MAKKYTSKFTGQEIDDILTAAQESVSDIEDIYEKLKGKRNTVILSYNWDINYLKTLAANGRVWDHSWNNISQAIINGEYDNITIRNIDFNSNEDKISSSSFQGYLFLVPERYGHIDKNASHYVLITGGLPNGTIIEPGTIILVLEKDVPDRWLAGYIEGFHALKAKTTLNIENGTGTNALQMKQDPKTGDGTFSFVGKNPNAITLDPSLNDENIPYGATGDFATVVGGKASAQGKRSMAQGTTTIAKGAYSHAEGDNSVALGGDSHAEGYATVASGSTSHSEGDSTKATNKGSHSEGYSTTASGEFSHAEGHLSTASGKGAHATGNETLASGQYSTTAGSGTVAGYADQFVVGRFNENNVYSIFQVGNGSQQHRHNVFEVTDFGYATVDKTEEKPKCVVNVEFLENSLKTLKDYVDNSLPNYTNFSTATNLNNGFVGQIGHEFYPFKNIEGGKNSYASYDGDFVFGTGLKNTMENQAVFGKYNDHSNWSNNKPLLMIGNGENDETRSNAFEVYLNGDISIGGTYLYTSKKYLDLQSTDVVGRGGSVRIETPLSSSGANASLYPVVSGPTGGSASLGTSEHPWTSLTLSGSLKIGDTVITEDKLKALLALLNN